MSQFRQFWIYRNEDYAPTYACDFNQRGFVPSRNKESIHVIEYAAVEQLKAEIAVLKDNAQRDFKDIQELKTIIKEMSDHSKGYAHCGLDMFAHTKWRKFADELK